MSEEAIQQEQMLAIDRSLLIYTDPALAKAICENLRYDFGGLPAATQVKIQETSLRQTGIFHVIQKDAKINHTSASFTWCGHFAYGIDLTISVLWTIFVSPRRVFKALIELISKIVLVIYSLSTWHKIE